jgi:hypothetical protein
VKKLRHISHEVQLEILHEYQQKEHGVYTWKLKEIAVRHEISLSSVNKLVKATDCPGRPRGGKPQAVPSARVMKILRDASEPFITYAEVGRRNAHWTVVDGKRKLVAMSRARVSKIVQHWRKKLGANKIRGKGFKPGDLIDWDSTHYYVLRYDNAHRGAVLEKGTATVIDPFCWIFQRRRSHLVEATAEELTMDDVLKRYLPCDDSVASPEPANGAPA